MILLVFESTHSVIKAEKKIRAASLPCQVIPVPRNLSSRCGMALEVHAKDQGKILKLLSDIRYECHERKI